MKTKYKLLLLGCIVMTVMGITGTVISIATYKPTPLLGGIMQLIRYSIVAIYAFWGYRKPHGRTLKRTMILFTVSFLSSIKFDVERGNVIGAMMIAVIMMTVSYVAGRLHRDRQNRFLMGMVLVILIAYGIFTWNTVFDKSFAMLFACFCNPIVWTDICCAYYLRFAQHRDSGLAFDNDEIT